MQEIHLNIAAATLLFWLVILLIALLIKDGEWRRGIIEYSKGVILSFCIMGLVILILLI